MKKLNLVATAVLIGITLFSCQNDESEAGIGLIGMKAARHLAPKAALGSDDTTIFDKFYDEKFMTSPLSPFQRSYAYVLEHGIDVVNADMQNFKHLEENIIAASTSHIYFG